MWGTAHLAVQLNRDSVSQSFGAKPDFNPSGPEVTPFAVSKETVKR